MENVVQGSEVNQETVVTEQPTAEITPNAGETTESSEPAPYTPNFKVKSYDKEYEIPENFRTLIKDANTEKEVREVFEKAYAVETLKEKNNKYRENYESVNKKYSSLEAGVKKLEKYLVNEDYESFFKTINLNEENLQKWMLQKLSLKDLPPEAQDAYNKKSEYQRQLIQKEEEAEFYKTQYEQYQESLKAQKVQAVHTQLDTLIADEKVSAVAQAFDQRLGQAGAFKNEVIQRAFLVEKTTGVELTPEQAVQEVLKLYGWNSTSPVQAKDKVLPPSTGNSKASIPSITGKTTSPVSQKITSLEDLKKLKQSVLAEERANALRN